MKKIILKSEYPCLIKTDEISYELDENDKLEIEDEDRIFVYPAVYSRHNIPFYINLNNLQNTSRYSVYDMEDFTLLLLNTDNDLVVTNTENLFFNGEKCEIAVTKNEIKFAFKNYCVSYNCLHDTSNYKIFKTGNFACLEFQHDLYVFNTLNSHLSHFEGEDIEFEKNTLSLNSKLDDCENRIKKATFKFLDDKINVESLLFDYNSGNFAEELSPYRFLEAIKVKDYRFAKNLLDERLKINEENLSRFLGNVVGFLPLSTDDFIVISESGKNFVRFETKNGQIVDISVDKLV